jgi:hypothetical protein
MDADAVLSGVEGSTRILVAGFWMLVIPAQAGIHTISVVPLKFSLVSALFGKLFTFFQEIQK